MSLSNFPRHLIVRIKWSFATELVDIPITEKPSADEVEQSEEYRHEVDRTVTYHTTSERKILGDGSHQVIIHYKKENNDELLKEFGSSEFLWGCSIITISPDFRSAAAEWRSDPPNPEWDGEASCDILSGSISQDIKREFASRIQRQQHEFKKELVFNYGCCAISGEKTPQALDAAHIYEAKAGGAESLSNGILLRSDLHRLYDAGLFEISMDGTIKITGDVSKDYVELLNGKVIEKKIINRIKDALLARTAARSINEIVES